MSNSARYSRDNPLILLGLFAENNDLKIIDNGIYDIRIVGTVTLLVLILICCVGMEWETKAQNFLIVTIVLAIFNFIIGAAIGPGGDKDLISKGFVGLSCKLNSEECRDLVWLTLGVPYRVHVQGELRLGLSLCRGCQSRLLQRVRHLLSQCDGHSGGCKHLW